MKLDISPDVAQRLGYYVYVYVDPRTEEVFYVGKGMGSRALVHLDATDESRKVRRIQAIRASGIEPRIDILSHNLPDEQTAFRIEAAIIELLGIAELTNEVRGWHSVDCQRKALRDFILESAPPKIDIVDPSLLIRINRLFRYGMSDEALYEATRGVWVIGPRRSRARYAMAVYAGVVREVYTITSWHAAGTTPYRTRDGSTLRQARRWEFSGSIAPEELRTRYIGGSVELYFSQGQQNPVVGVLL